MASQNLFVATLLGVAFVAATGAQAQDVGQHPAVFTPRQLPSIDPSRFIVAHPAGLTWRRGHANHEHPALASHAAGTGVQPDRYLVQPPAATRWTTGSVPSVTVLR